MTLVVLHLKAGEYMIHPALGLRETLPMNHDSTEPSLGLLQNPLKGLVCHQGPRQLHNSHVKRDNFMGFGGLLRCLVNSRDDLAAGDKAQKCQMKHSHESVIFSCFFFLKVDTCLI